MQLKKIYQPIEKELADVEDILRKRLNGTHHKSILEINNFILAAKGKRLRPALVVLSARAGSVCAEDANQPTPSITKQLTNIAAAIELVHTASLIHDDVIDHAKIRHNKATVNYRWSNDVSIAFGDYLYSIAFKLVSTVGNNDVLECISSATEALCEGELIQICERDNIDLLKERYMVIVKKKTASLFAASCQAGAILSRCETFIQTALKEYGLNFGIAFQIMDDCLDIVGGERELGKTPGTDFRLGELTLPALNLISKSKDKTRIIGLMNKKDDKNAFDEIKKRFIQSQALFETVRTASSYIAKAKRELDNLEESRFKDGLSTLADYVAGKLMV